MKKLLYTLLFCFCFSATAQNASTIQQLLDEGVTVGELLDAGLTPDEFYGIEYEDGVIFDIDTINGVGRVALITDKVLPFQCYSGSEQYPTISTDENNGMQNTINIASSCPENITGSSYALNYVSNGGMNDWYIPTRNDFESMHQNLILNHFWADISHNFMISEIANATRYWTGRFQYLNNSEEDCCYWNDETRTSTSRLLLVREFDLSAPTINEVSPALQSFLETYTPPVVEEEIVSDANSFDVLNPLSYNGEFETVHHDFSDGEYVVPNDKTLIINQIYEYGGNYYIEVDDVYVGETNTESTHVMSLRLPVVVGEEKTVKVAGSNGPINASTFQGVLINNSIGSVHHDFINGDYIVPDNKTLVIFNLYGSSPNSLYINSSKVFNITTTNLGDGILIPLYAQSDNIVSNPTFTNYSTFHGILINNSNYTYTTDYELIDALNEGMDSLSTLSEDVALENDSISSQNAILSQENEALMAIDYNFDSLQYVADYLSTQVFDLQQELLVPNIEVDMAIGWNMIGFSCPEEKELTDALNEIVDEVLIMKNNNGSVFMPEFSFNGIGDLTPGHGYQIKVADYILDFNICE